MSSSSSLPTEIVGVSLKRKANEMEDESQNSPRCIDVDPQGQVLFKVGEGDAARNIRVYGPLLCQAAPAFAKVLSSAPKNGNDKVVRRRIGDPEVYLDFFNMIHYKHTDIHKRTGLRLAQLAELAVDMGCRAESFRPFIAYKLFPVIHEITTASNDKKGTKIAIKALEEHQVTFEELLSIASYCEMNELFWRTTKVAVVQSPKQLGPPPVDNQSWHAKLYDQINKERDDVVRGFLSGIFKCIDKCHPVIPDGKDVREALTSYGALHCFLRTEGIIAHEISNYKGALAQAIEVVRRMADLAKAKVNSKDTLPGSDDTIVNTLAGRGEYVVRDMKNDLLELIDTHTLWLSGISLVSFNDSMDKDEVEWNFWKLGVYGEEADMSGL